MKNTLHHKCKSCNVEMESNTCTWFAFLDNKLHCETCLLEKLERESIQIEINITFNTSEWNLLITQGVKINSRSEDKQVQNIHIVDESIETPFFSITSSTSSDVHYLANSRVFGNSSSLNIGLIPYESISDVVSIKVQVIEKLQKINTLQFTVDNNSFLSNKQNLLVKNPDVLNECISCGRRENGPIYIRTLINNNGLCEHCFEENFSITVKNVKFRTAKQAQKHNTMYRDASNLYYSIEYTLSNSHIVSILSSDLYNKQVIPWIETTLIKEDGSTSLVMSDLRKPARREFEICGHRMKDSHIRCRQFSVCVPSDFLIAKTKLKTPKLQTSSITYNIECPNVVETSKLEMRL